jgi:hypothetical protein
MARRPEWWAVASADLVDVVVVDDKGGTWHLDLEAFLQLAAERRARILTAQQHLIRRLVVEAHKADADATLATLAGAPGGLRIASVSWRGQQGWRAVDVSGLYPGRMSDTATDLGLPFDALSWRAHDAGDLEATAHSCADLHAAWCGVLEDISGVKPRGTIAGTAAAAAIPARWHRWANALGRSDQWAACRRAYYGGRVQWWEDRTPPTGADVDVWDVNSLYGSVMLERLPDPKTFGKHSAAETCPSWHDVTVRVYGDPGPLPRRDSDQPWRLEWPTSGEWRGWYTAEDLDRPGVRILQTHGVVGGRWDNSLAEPVGRWLDLRASSSCPATRRAAKLMVNTLAGKLCQRVSRWILVPAADAPLDAYPIHPDFPLFAWPTAVGVRQPFSAPAVGSWVTARARSVVWPELVAGAHYTDTDSVHRPAGAPPPANVGTAPGQWSLEASGPSEYHAPKRYTVGGKTAGIQRKSIDWRIG